jgi:hypothetical protein
MKNSVVTTVNAILLLEAGEPGAVVLVGTFTMAIGIFNFPFSRPVTIGGRFQA